MVLATLKIRVRTDVVLEIEGDFMVAWYNEAFLEVVEEVVVVVVVETTIIRFMEFK